MVKIANITFQIALIWLIIASLLVVPVDAFGTGGTITTDGQYIIHTFTSNGTFTPPNGTTLISLLLIGGGGAGGSDYGGGGGAGGLIYNYSYTITQTPYSVVVGIGGNTTGTNQRGANGTNSSFDSLVALGGGGGGSYVGGVGLSGGSGGGGAGVTNTAAGTGNVSQGNNGGIGAAAPQYRAGGGGGANATGTAGTSQPNGGAGANYSINGTQICYAGGGGGGYGDPGYTYGIATCGGGNGGIAYGSNNGAPGTNGTGGGGGGGSGGIAPGGNGGAGGSGIVIIRYLSPISWGNNYTDNSTLNFSITESTHINFNVSNTSFNADSFSWFLNGVNQATNQNNINLTISSVGINNISAYVYNGSQVSSATWFVTVPFTLLTPANGSSLNNSYPPMNMEVNFSWNSVGYPYYELVISKNSAFSLIASDTYTTSTNKNVSLGVGDYWWKVRNYDPDSGTWGDYSSTFNFTITNVVSSSGKAGIHGVIYENINGVDTPISGAIVYVSNTALNWSSFQTTGSNGYYNFDNLTNGTTYNVYATKIGYITSPTEYVTTGNGVWSTKDIFLRKCISELDCGLSTHYVNFIVQNLWGTKYSNIAATVYTGSDIIASDSGTTGTDGAVAFFLTKDQSYRITFINASQGISHSVTLTPSDSIYYIIVSQTASTWGDTTSASEAVTVTLTSELIGTTGYINVTWNNSVAGTTGLVFYLNQTNKTNGSAPQINIETINAGANDNYFASFAGIASAGSKDYVVNIVSTHSTYGTIYRTYGVQFIGLPTTALDFIPAALKGLFAIAIIIFVGALAGHSSRAQMAGICCVLAWVFILIGFFSYWDTRPIIAGTTIATIITVLWNINERQAQEQI